MEKQDLLWLDEAFAKGVIDELEASCCLAGINEMEVQVKDVHLHNVHWSDILHDKVSKIFGIIKSWPNFTGYMPLLWYIEQAIIRDAPYVNYSLLLPKCKETEHRRNEIIKSYPELAKKIGLIETISDSVFCANSIADSLVNEDAEYPKDRNDRLFRRAVELAKEYKNPQQIKIDNIHNKIIEEEKNKSKVSKVTLKREVQLNKVKLALNIKSEKVT